jgi:hypothetical protein
LTVKEAVRGAIAETTAYCRLAYYLDLKRTKDIRIPKANPYITPMKTILSTEPIPTNANTTPPHIIAAAVAK